MHARRRRGIRNQRRGPLRSPPPIPFLHLRLLFLHHQILHLFLHRIHSHPQPVPCAHMTTLSRSSLTPMTLSSHLISLIHPIQTPHSSRSAATSTANNLMLKPCVSSTKPIHPHPLSTNLSTSLIAPAPHAASFSSSAPSKNLNLALHRPIHLLIHFTSSRCTAIAPPPHDPIKAHPRVAHHF